MKPVCRSCGSDDVTCDATARWDEDTQNWELSGVFDSKTCGQCSYEKDYCDWVVLEEEEKPVVNAFSPNLPRPESDRLYLYKGQKYRVNSVLERNLTQFQGEWQPTVRYTSFPDTTGLVFYRALGDFQKFEALNERIR